MTSRKLFSRHNRASAHMNMDVTVYTTPEQVQAQFKFWQRLVGTKSYSSQELFTNYSSWEKENEFSSMK